MHRTGLAAALLLLLFCHLFAQKGYVLHHLTIKDGLASSQTIGFAQDNKGFIWMATAGGLQRFDGQNFITYRHNDNDSSSLFYDEVFYPVIDKENNIWLKSPDSYINILNPVNGKVKRITVFNKSDKEFICYCKDSKGIMWICSNKALFKYNYQTSQPEKIVSFPYYDSSVFNHPMLYDSLNNAIWFSTRVSLVEYDIDKNKFYDHKNNPANCPLLSLKSEPYTLYIDRQNNFWVTTWQYKFFRYNLVKHSFKQYAIPKILANGNPDKTADFVKGIVQDKNENIWIGTDNGSVLLYNNEKDSFDVAIKQLNELSYSNNIGIVSMFHDMEGNVWMATAFGVYFFNPEKQKIFSVTNNPFNKNSLPATQVQAFYETSNKLIWVASRSDEGVSVFDENFNLIKRILFQNNSNHTTAPIYFITAFCEDDYNNLWMITATNELICYNLSSNKFYSLKIAVINYVSYSMAKDAAGNIWIGCGSTLVKFNPLTKSFINYSTNRSYEIRDMCIDRFGNIWIGTLFDRLYLFDTKKEAFVERLTLNQNKQSLDYGDIISMREYNDSILLIGTGKGIIFFNKRTKKFKALECGDGNLSNVIQGINCDDKGNIYTGTFHGLYKIDAATHKYTNYTSDDGITEDMQYTKLYKLRDGRMIEGGLNSFIYFNPEDLRKTFTPPDVQITGFKIFDTQYEPDTLLDKEGILHLKYKENFITIQYADLFYSAPSKIHYYYKLDGLDKKWVNANRRRNAVYTNLSNGNYTFEVKCVNDEGIACTNITKLNLIIAMPYYKSWWFILLCTVTLICLVYFLYRIRINQIRTNEQKQVHTMIATQEQERKRISRDLHDDIGTKLSALKLFVSSFKNNISKQQYNKAAELAENSEQLINDTMKDVREMLLNLSPTVLEEFGYTVAVETLVNKINSAKLIQFKLVLFGLNKRLPHEYELALYRITQELINNVLKHAEAKNVSLQIGYRDQRIILMIEDDGKGFDVSAHKDGYGLKNLDARTKLLHGTLHLDSATGKGTSILIEIPFQI